MLLPGCFQAAAREGESVRPRQEFRVGLVGARSAERVRVNVERCEEALQDRCSAESLLCDLRNQPGLLQPKRVPVVAWKRLCALNLARIGVRSRRRERGGGGGSELCALREESLPGGLSCNCTHVARV